MKNTISILIISISIFIFSSCKTENNNVNPSSPTSTSINTNTPGTGWRLSLYSERNENKTSHYNSYTFSFSTDGSMTAEANGQVTTGTWKQYSDDGITKFAINLNTSDNDLMDLNDDWALVSKSDNFISLQDDNSSKNEQLQFSK